MKIDKSWSIENGSQRQIVLKCDSKSKIWFIILCLKYMYKHLNVIFCYLKE